MASAKPTPDRLVEFILERGDQGVTLSELVWEFLRPASASPQLCERILRPLLEKEARIREIAGGRWAPAAKRPDARTEGYTVIESLAARISARRTVEVEVSALRIDPSGRPGERLTLVVLPDPFPPRLTLGPRLRGKMRSAISWDAAVTQIASFASRTVLVCHRPTPFVAAVRDLVSAREGSAPILALQRLARAVVGKDAARSREEMASALGCTEREIETAEDAATSSAEALSAFLSKGMADADSILAAQHPERHAVDLDGFAFTRERLAALPTSPGIYIMRDANGDAVYVGKARDLRQRVNSYFRSRIDRDERVEAILDATYSLDVELAGSELEALLMEYRAIRELAPAVNLQFDVHARESAQRAEDRRVVAVLPSVKPRCAELFLVRGVEAMQQVRLSARWSRRAADGIRRFFYSKRPEPEGDPAEIRIFWSWYARRRDEIRMIDVDAASGAGNVNRLARELFRDILAGQARAFRV